MATSGILPTYQRFVNGVPVALARRSFRPREKYVILLVFATFGLVCFGTFFFLPEFRSGGGTADSVYKVYDQFKKAGPEFLIPPPPLLEENQKVVRHDRDTQDDPHVLDDREKLRAKIAQDDSFKVLEKPELYTKTSSTSRSVNLEKVKPGEDSILEAGKVTIPPAFSDHYPDVNHGEDTDLKVQERRNKIKEIAKNSLAHLKITKLEMCDSSVNYPLMFTNTIKGEDGKQYLTGKADFKVDFGADSDGTYEIKDYLMDFRKIAYQSVPEGIFQATQIITNKNTKEVLLCMLSEGDNFV